MTKKEAMTAEQFVHLIYPGHDRSSCSDTDTDYNGWCEQIPNNPYRCRKCVFLQIARGEVEVTDLMYERMF